VIYSQGPAYASLIAKEVGARSSGVDANGNPIDFGSYTITNFASSYTFNKSEGLGKNTKIGFQINNLFNYNDIYASFATDANGNPMYYVVPTRSYTVSLSVDM
jgi:iron complex outermembrane receptor protein